MELDFSEQIKNLNILKSADMQTKPDNAEMAMKNKSVCKICAMKWGSCAHANDVSNMMEEGPDHESKETSDEEMTEDMKAGSTCKDCSCGKSSSECTCADCTSKTMQKSESAKDMKHPDKEDKKDIQSEKGNPKAEKQEEANPKDKKKFPFNKMKASLAEKVAHMLETKIQAHNEKFEQNLTFAQLNKVYSRGLNVFNSTHKPGVSLHQWAVARVNLFLKMMSGGQVKNEYSLLDSDIANASSGVITESGLASYDFINFSDLEFQLAKISLLEAGLTEQEMHLEISQSEEKKK